MQQWLTLSTSDQWKVVDQSHLQCICELQGDWFSFLRSVAFYVKEVEFTLPKINFVCVNGCHNKRKMRIVSQYASSGEVLLFRRKDSKQKRLEKMKSITITTRLSESNVGVRIAQRLFCRERNS